LLVAFERFGNLGDDFRNVDLEHQISSRTGGAPITPVASAAAATRMTRSSRQGAAKIWTPSGSGPPCATGAARAGRPANDNGWVKTPRWADESTCAPSTS